MWGIDQCNHRIQGRSKNTVFPNNWSYYGGFAANGRHHRLGHAKMLQMHGLNQFFILFQMFVHIQNSILHDFYLLYFTLLFRKCQLRLDEKQLKFSIESIKIRKIPKFPYAHFSNIPNFSNIPIVPKFPFFQNLPNSKIPNFSKIPIYSKIPIFSKFPIFLKSTYCFSKIQMRHFSVIFKHCD